jgi:GTPase SAR1 family protein
MSSTLTLNVCLVANEGISREIIVSNFLNRLLKDKYKIIVGVDAPTSTVERKVSLQFWIYNNTSDWEEYISKQISGSNGIVIIYDVTDPETLKWATDRIQSIRNNLDYVPPILLIGDKIELKKNRIISDEQIKEFVEVNEISSTTEISLKTGKNIEKTFMKLTEMMLRNTDYDYKIDVNRITPFRGYKYLGILIAVLIYVISVITSLIAYLIFLVF